MLTVLRRCVTIVRTVWRHDLHRLPWLPKAIRWPLNVLYAFSPLAWHRPHTTPVPERLKTALEDLGPLFVKAGQLLATRRDILPTDYADALATLQDNVPPFDGQLAVTFIEKACHKPITACFATFDITPLAAASIAQVHAATLHTGEDVVVKVLRPNIEKKVAQDCQLLSLVATLLALLWPGARPFKPRAVANEIIQTLQQELDLRQEAANANLLARHFVGSPLIHVPKVYWDFTARNIMVQERINGIPIYDIEKLKAQGYNFKRLAERGVEIFFTQVFRDRFFHADMHAGNIFVTGSPEYPQYAAVDFGIMGTLSPEDQTYLAINFLAFFHRDYARIAQCHIESGWVPADTSAVALETAFRTVLEPIFAKPIREISFGQMLLRLIEVARAHRMSIQPQLLLLQKTLVAVEGLGRELYPDLDLWQTAKPYLEGWARKQFGLKASYKTFKTHWPLIQHRLPYLAEQVSHLLRPAAQRRQARPWPLIGALWLTGLLALWIPTPHPLLNQWLPWCGALSVLFSFLIYYNSQKPKRS